VHALISRAIKLNPSAIKFATETAMNPFKSTRKGLSARRLLLLASVAATAITVVAFGPSSYVSSGFASFITPARAAGRHFCPRKSR
jgi:hypothetical protein